MTKNQNYVFNSFVMKLINLHSKLHECSLKNDKLNEEYFLDKYFRLYDSMCQIFNKKEIDDVLIEHSKNRKLGMTNINRIYL